MFLCDNCLPICLGFFLFFVCVFVSITPKPMNRSLLKNLWVGSDGRMKLLKERSGSYCGYKKKSFQRSHFNVFLMTLAIYLIFL